MYRVVPSQSTWTPTELQCLHRELAKYVRSSVGAHRPPESRLLTGLRRYPQDAHVRLTSYVKVAAALKHKTVRDVAAKVAHMRGVRCVGATVVASAVGCAGSSH